MNYISLSPYYPQNFQPFSRKLKEEGVTVLGIGEEPYDQLGKDLQDSLTEYFRVNSMEDDDEMKRAVAFLFHKHGPIDRIESNNEHWLELESRLREQFNIFGSKPSDLKKVKYKSKMKKRFKKAGVPVAAGYVANTLVGFNRAVNKLGFPVVAKPDNGVGSAATYKITNEEEANNFRSEWDGKISYFIETYIEGARLCTYDGLIDKNGEVVFQSSFYYTDPTLETLKEQKDLAYIIEKDIDPKLEAYGRSIVKAFGMKERFFHIEFFKKDGDYLALEYNNRLAGGYTIDMYNFAYSVDLFEEYAKMVAGKSYEIPEKASHFCIGVSQRDAYDYKHYEKEIKEQYPGKVKFSKRMPKAFSKLQGDQFYAINVDTEEQVDEVIHFVHEK